MRHIQRHIIRGDKKILQDKKIIKELSKQGIKEVNFSIFKLYNQEAYSKMESQSYINLDIAIKNYSDKIQESCE